MENLIDVIADRWSVRSFSDRKVEQEKVDLIMRAGNLAPTAMDRQPQRILAITGKEALERLMGCKGQRFGETLAFVVCYDAQECCNLEDGRSSGIMDASIVGTHMMLEAASLGVGSVWALRFDPQAVRREFGLPESVVPAFVLSMGYPAGDAQPNPRHFQRKEIGQTVTVMDN